MIEPIVIAKCAMDKEPYLMWNAFIDIIACEEISKMNDIQKKASLCFWYDSELQNGGHLQYFENTSIIGNTDYQEVIDALNWLGANSQAEILQRAVNIYYSKARGFIRSVLEFVNTARTGEYDVLDNEYYNCKPDMAQLLEKLLTMYQNEFVVIEEQA